MKTLFNLVFKCLKLRGIVGLNHDMFYLSMDLLRDIFGRFYLKRRSLSLKNCEFLQCSDLILSISSIIKKDQLNKNKQKVKLITDENFTLKRFWQNY